MTELERIFFWLALFSYALGFTLYLTTLVMKIGRHAGKALACLCGGFLLETVTIAVRWQATGHVPTVGNYEYALAGSWLIILMTIYLVVRHRQLQFGALVTLACSILLLGFGYSTNPALRPLAVAMISNWLMIHIIFSWLAFSAYTVAFALGALYLAKSGNPGAETGILSRLPSIDAIDDLMFNYVSFGFINHFLSMSSGAIWAKSLWGNYWSWDPVESWTLVSWLIYGLIIHLRVSLGWQGKRLALMTVLALSAVVISFFGVNWFVNGSQHAFNVQ